MTHPPRYRLVIVGSGQVGRKVAELAAGVDFDVCVVDDRPQECTSQQFPQARELLVGPLDQVLPRATFDADTYCVIVTRSRIRDERALAFVIQSSARYIGMIGSRRKVQSVYDELLRSGVPADTLRRVSAPLGFHIGSQTVNEIAISIVAELIAHRNLGPEYQAQAANWLTLN